MSLSLTPNPAAAVIDLIASTSPTPTSDRNAAYQRFTHTLSESPASTPYNPITLTRFIHAEQQLHPSSTGSLTALLHSLQLAIKLIAQQTRRAALGGAVGLAGGATNASGDAQKVLDVWANECMLQVLTYSEQVDVMVSEEVDHAVLVERGDGVGSGYAVVFDPLDGSSNIDCNLSVGTIFGIYSKQSKSPSTPSSPADVLRPGDELVCAGYASYDAATMLVLTTGHGVNGFTLDPTLGEFVLTHRHIRIPAASSIYSLNEANALSYEPPIQAYLARVKQRKGTSARYVGSMVGDVHRSLLYGGLFLYPADAKSPSGKLRLLYECNPVAFIVEQAGGLAVRVGGGGKVQRVREVVPAEIHERCPIVVGSRDAVLEVVALYEEWERNGSVSKLQAKL